jgi:hypothetical protein
VRADIEIFERRKNMVAIIVTEEGRKRLLNSGGIKEVEEVDSLGSHSRITLRETIGQGSKERDHIFVGESPDEIAERINTALRDIFRPLTNVAGDKMPDGTIYAGISPETGRPMYAMAADALLTVDFNAARQYTAALSAQKAFGRDDWRMPSVRELTVLFNSRSAIEGLNADGPPPAGWYWSSVVEADNKSAWAFRFNDGLAFSYPRHYALHLRCVRG